MWCNLTSFRLIIEVKQHRVWLVPGYVTISVLGQVWTWIITQKCFHCNITEMRLYLVCVHFFSRRADPIHQSKESHRLPIYMMQQMKELT